MEFCPVCLAQRQVNRARLEVAQLLENRLQILHLVVQAVGTAEVYFIPVVVLQDHIVFLFHVHARRMLQDSRAVQFGKQRQHRVERRLVDSCDGLPCGGVVERHADDLRILLLQGSVDALKRLAGRADQPDGIGVRRSGKGKLAFLDGNDDRVRKHPPYAHLVDIRQRRFHIAADGRPTHSKQIVSELQPGGFDNFIACVDGIALYLDAPDLEKDCHTEDHSRYQRRHNQKLSAHAAPGRRTPRCC